MAEAVTEEAEIADQPNYVVGRNTWLSRTLAWCHLAKPRWDPVRKQRWDEASARGELGSVNDAPPGFLLEFCRACIAASEKTEQKLRYERMMKLFQG